MLRKIRTDATEQVSKNPSGGNAEEARENTQFTNYTQTTSTPKSGLDKWLNYMIGGLGLVVLVLIVSLIVRINNSDSNANSEQPTNEVASDPSGASYDDPTSKHKIIRVEVLNGSGTPKMASKAADYLRARGFDVVNTGNAPNSGYKTSVVQDRLGIIQNAQQVAAALGIPESGIIQQKNQQLLLEVTVIIGQDYKTLKFMTGR